MMESITGHTLDMLRTFDTPTVCNGIELFGVQAHTVGYMDGSIRADFPELPPMVGFAATATCRTGIEPRGESAYTKLPDQIARFEELSGPPVVVFQDLDNPVRAATFGEIMCTSYKAFGAVGLITSGAGRDLDQVRRIGFPTFTGSTIASHGYIQILDTGTPVHVGGIAVYPDDLIHGDLNGVAIVPRSIANDLPDVLDAFVAAEAALLDVLKREGVTLAEMRDAVSETDARIAELGQRVRRKDTSP
jgi:regulator of RNase E activity RraA